MSFFRRKKTKNIEPAWDNGRIAMDQIEAAVVVCSLEGQVLDLSPEAQALFSKFNIKTDQIPFQLPTSLWDALLSKNLGKEIDWRSEEIENACLGCTVYSLGPMFYLLLMKDVSAKHKMLSFQLYSQRQEVLGNVSATIAHQLRTPLSSVLFNIEALCKKWKSLPPQEVQTLLEEIRTACYWQKLSITSFIDSANINPYTTVQLGLLFDTISEVLHPIYREKSHKLVFQIDRQQLVHGTPLLLEHVLINILMNSLEASITPITTEIVSDLVERPSVSSMINPSSIRYVRLLISDNGPGVPPHIRPHIFDPFFTTKANGNGIGLTLARQTIRDLNGDLRLVNVRKGACFEVLLLAATETNEGGEDGN